MNVILYNVSDDPRVLNKNIGSGTTLSCTLVYPSELLSPTIRISANSWNASLNYMYISDFNRFYFITEVSYENGGAVLISGRVDPLMTYRNNISDLRVNVIRQEYGGLTNIVDNQVCVTPKQETEFVKANNTPFNIRTSGAETNFVLCIAGGAVGGE